MNNIPYDYAIFAEIKKLEKKYKVNVVPLFGYDLTLEDCNLCDSIFCIYEGVYSFNDGKMDQYKKYMNILKKTSANVYPSQKMQEFIINKHKYMKYLKKTARSGNKIKYFIKYKIIFKLYTFILFIFYTIKKILLLRF